MSGRIRNGVRALLGASSLLLLVACQVVVGGRAAECDDGPGETAVVVPAREPLLSRDPSMKAIAADLDHLEKHIDWYGSVVSKAPDVWGQARLTSYRQDTEKRLRNELDGFVVSSQGSVTRIDVADLLVQLTVDGTQNAATVSAANKANSEAALKLAEASRLEAEKKLLEVKAAQAANAATPAAVEAAVKEIKAAAADLNKAATNIAAAAASGTAPAAVSDPPGAVATGLAKGTALEPVRILEQKDRYLNYLNQLRRKNEGDDTSDAPGYSLNLVRIPVSLLPGKKTDRGYGAEVTFTINPLLDEELLPNTFKELVVNDLLHLMAFPFTKLLEEEDLKAAWRDTQFRALLNTDRPEVRAAVETDHELKAMWLRRYGPNTPASTAAFAPKRATRTAPAGGAAPAAPAPTVTAFSTLSQTQKSALVAQRLTQYARFVSYSVESKGTRPMPPTQMVEAFGETFLYEIARLVFELTEELTAERGGYAHMPDVQAVLREHLIAAYRFLARPESRYLWETFCTAELADAVRTHRQDWVYDKRKEFREMVRRQSGTKYIDAFDPCPELDTEVNKFDRLVHFSATTGLAWAILLDSALLNVRLMEDLKRTETVAGVRFLTCDWPKFYLPDPPAEDRQTFNEYVRRRWPIHVFTLDPATDEQNLADALSTVRTTQLALALAFMKGKMTTNAFVNATRKVQSTYETIQLNRTQVGFAHGDNTFGWRFYPRFQTPPVRGNLQTFVGGNLLGINAPNDGLRSRRLEPGPRECVAVVLMPAFVPNATLDAVGNWFALANPKHKVLDHTQALRLSHTVQALRTDGCGVKDAHKYRAEDHRLLLARAEQLAARLPMQTARFQVPTVNSYGGFELFGTSTTDLAPELYGWYGAPGLKACEDTVLFLAGDHFSVNHTRVLVGNVEVKDVVMLSRQVMKVTVPKGVLPVSPSVPPDGKPLHAHIHLATPYGVSRELEIPVLCPPLVCPPATPAPAAAGTLKADVKLEGEVKLTPK